MWKGVALGILIMVQTARAEPMLRFGLTFGVDRNAPEAHEVGPLAAVGLRAGRFSSEINYTYLSFFDHDTTIHRFGVALRANLIERAVAGSCAWQRCMTSRALYAELGAAKRYGRWLVDESISAYQTEPQLEAAVALGYELGQQRGSKWTGWQLGLRFGVSRRDPLLGMACRGTGCEVAMPASSGLAESVMLEWMFLLGQ